MSFSHLDAGTPEHRWRGAGVGRLPVATAHGTLGAYTLLVVAAAHPDDETLGATALIRSVLTAGGRVRIIMASAGEGSHPDSPTHTPQQLVSLRAAELDAAVDALAEGHRERIELVRLGLPDGSVASHLGAVRAAVGTAVDGHDGPVLLATHYRRDGHADHDALGAAVAALAAARGLDLYEFPIWFWHWADPERHGDWREFSRWPLTAADRAARQAALDAHASQARPLSPAAGDEAVLSPGMLEHVTGRDYDAYRHTPAPERGGSTRAREVFDRLYREHDDPWRYRESWYERRKRRVTLAAMPRERYGTVIEVGSSIGVLTAELADRADRVIGLEASATARERAVAGVGGRPGVEFRQAVVPDEWPTEFGPDDPADAIVLSEIGYFLSGPELGRVLDACARSLALSGHLVLCHWHHEVSGWPLDGGDVHEAVAADPSFRLVSRHREQDFVVDVHARASAADRVAVVVPARNEEDRLPPSLAALARAADRWEEVNAQGSVRVVVALDHCTDATAGRAEEFAATDGRFHVLDLTGRKEPTVGQARDLGIRHGVRLLTGANGEAGADGETGADGEAAGIWVASTDADTAVPEDWLVGQAALAAGADGAVLVAGTVELDPEGLPESMQRRWQEQYTHAEDHGHVHGANLGLSWEVYERLGGFPHVAEHEDVELVAAARAAGVRVLATDRIRAVTSGRTDGRTPGGFAGHLRDLSADDA